MVLGSINAMLAAASDERRVFPATTLYNENWLLRIVLDWFASHPDCGHDLQFAPGARWFSEAWLPSAFPARQRNDPLAEGWTHADGVIGHFEIGRAGVADVVLSNNARQFVVVEAKMFSQLSLRVRNANYYDQAARTVACMAEVLRRAGRYPDETIRLAFYVIAPSARIGHRLFAELVSANSIIPKVQRRALEYGGRGDWLAQWLNPLVGQMRVGLLSWECVIGTIMENDRESGVAIEHFYNRCNFEEGAERAARRRIRQAQ